MSKNIPGLNMGKSGWKELKQRLFFLLIGMLIFRIGAHVPVPGVDIAKLAGTLGGNGFAGMFNMLSGGAFKKFAVFALGVMPYISSSIIIQLLTSVVPSLEQLKKEGESGRRRINQYTRYATLAIAFFQAVGIANYIAASHDTVMQNPDFSFYFTAVITLVTGTMFLMWLGEQMTERGIGNGISLIIFGGIAANFPSAISATIEKVRTHDLNILSLLMILAIVVTVTGFVVFVERAQRRITVNYAKRQQGRKMYASQSSNLPFKINMSGVIPPIFASSILLIPVSLSNLFANSHSMSWISSIGIKLSPTQPLYMILYSLLIIFFCFFYTALTFNPKETAENLKKSGAFIPGIRPGEQTAQYIDSVMTKLTLVGAIYICLVALLPEMLTIEWNVPFVFGGTSLLIVVVVLMDFIAQIQALLMSYQYESLMKKANLRGMNVAGPGGILR